MVDLKAHEAFINGIGRADWVAYDEYTERAHFTNFVSEKSNRWP